MDKKIKKINAYWPSGIDGSDIVFDIPNEILRQKINEIIKVLNKLLKT